MLPQTAGWTPLFFAAKSGHLEIVKLLLDKGARIGIRDKVTKLFYHFRRSYITVSVFIDWTYCC